MSTGGRFHAQVEPFFETLTDQRVSSHIQMQWFKDPPLSITVAEALTQCVMHSQHHRGQNASRLRELGGEPPTTDYRRRRKAPGFSRGDISRLPCARIRPPAGAQPSGDNVDT